MALKHAYIHEKKLKRLSQRLNQYEQASRFLRKRSEDYDVLEEVFDKPTLLTLHKLINSGAFAYLNGVVKSGKEARVYWGVKESGESVAVKIFLVTSREFRKRLPYILGDPRFGLVNRGGREFVKLWAKKEFRNLSVAHEAGVPVPKPIIVKENVLVMEFIGRDGKAAPTIAEVPVSERDYGRLKRTVRTLYRAAALVHADLSEFNVFRWGRRLIVFDFASAVDVRHPMAKQFLIRDLLNLNRFFSKRGLGITPLDTLLTEVTGS